MPTNTPQVWSRPNEYELTSLLPRVLSASAKVDRHAALTLYLFLPVRIGQRNYRSSLEALLRDARGAGGRDLDTGAIAVPDQSRSWLAAIGYLALADQISHLLEVPEAAGPSATPFEHLLVWDGRSTRCHAAALYALRCAFVHSYGLLNDPRDRRQRTNLTSAKGRSQRDLRPRDRKLIHMFALDAVGGPAVTLGSRGFTSDTPVAEIEPTKIDLRSLADRIEGVVAHLRSVHLENDGLRLRPDIESASLIRACFFMHDDSIIPSGTAQGLAPSGITDTYLTMLDSSSPPVTGFNLES